MSSVSERARSGAARVKEAPGAVESWLTRGRLVGILVGVLAVAAVVVLIAVFARGWWRNQGGSYAPKAIASATQITPASSLFGDVLTVQARVAFDPGRYDQASVQLAPDFSPYVVNSESRRVESRVGKTTVVDFDYSIQCLTQPCIALMGQKVHTGTQAKTVIFPPAALTATTASGTAVKETVAWPPIVVHSRLSATQIALATPTIDPTPVLPALSWSISPDLLGALALVGAILLIAVACWLVVSVALGDSKLLVRRFAIPRHLSPVERALLLAEHASRSGELEEERKALQRLAVELRRAGQGELAGRAGRLAWSEGTPSSDTVEQLAGAVRSNGAH
jgi:hypothetical protein